MTSCAQTVRANVNEAAMQAVGTAEEFGAMAAFLCSAHGGYITGQNIVMDGGSYPGTL